MMENNELVQRLLTLVEGHFKDLSAQVMSVHGDLREIQTRLEGVPILEAKLTELGTKMTGIEGQVGRLVSLETRVAAIESQVSRWAGAGQVASAGGKWLTGVVGGVVAAVVTAMVMTFFKK